MGGHRRNEMTLQSYRTCLVDRKYEQPDNGYTISIIKLFQLNRRIIARPLGDFGAETPHCRLEVVTCFPVMISSQAPERGASNDH